MARLDIERLQRWEVRFWFLRIEINELPSIKKEGVPNREAGTPSYVTNPYLQRKESQHEKE